MCGSEIYYDHITDNFWGFNVFLYTLLLILYDNTICHSMKLSTSLFSKSGHYWIFSMTREVKMPKLLRPQLNYSFLRLSLVSDLPTHKKNFQKTRAPKHDFSGNLRLLSGTHHIGWFQSLKTLPWGFSWISVGCWQRQITVHEGCFKHRVSFCLNTELTEGHVLRNSAYSLWRLHAMCLLQSSRPPCPKLKSSRQVRQKQKVATFIEGFEDWPVGGVIK